MKAILSSRCTLLALLICPVAMATEPAFVTLSEMNRWNPTQFDRVLGANRWLQKQGGGTGSRGGGSDRLKVALDRLKGIPDVILEAAFRIGEWYEGRELSGPVESQGVFENGDPYRLLLREEIRIIDRCRLNEKDSARLVIANPGQTSCIQTEDVADSSTLLRDLIQIALFRGHALGEGNLEQILAESPMSEEDKHSNFPVANLSYLFAHPAPLPPRPLDCQIVARQGGTVEIPEAAFREKAKTSETRQVTGTEAWFLKGPEGSIWLCGPVR